MSEKIKTLHEINKINETKYANQFNYQKELTEKLDHYQKDFNQEIINEIVLWKINRYAQIDEKTLALINTIKTNSQFDEEKTKKILKKLLETKGIRLAMASTILRFKNPNLYQIIDQRVFRIIYGKEFKQHIKVDTNINTYLNYLKKLRQISEEKNLDFTKLDRILYELDKEKNKGIKIKY